MAVRMELATAATGRKLNYKLTSGSGDPRTPCPAGVSSSMATQHHTGYRAQGWATPAFYPPRYPHQANPPYLQNSTGNATNSYTSANNTTYANNQRVATSPSNTSSSSSHTGSQSGTVSNVSTSNMPSTSSNSNSGSETLSKTNLYIRGLSANTTDKDLENMCKKFGAIISTKAILDKNTNKCKGYGFVDFEHPASAEGAVKALTAANVQAQMAKVGNSPHYRLPTQQEQDPTNLYIANLPLNYKESDVDKLLCQHGQVISTRILRDSTGTSKGVGFARMETREKCEHIIQLYNGMKITGSKEGLLVKFADGGNKKKNVYKNNDSNKWRDGTDSCIPAVSYDPSALAQNGVPTTHMVPTITGFRPYSQVQNYPIPANTQWVPPYIMSAAPIASMEDGYNIPSHMGPYKNDGQAPRGISVMMPSSDYMPQLTAQMGAVQLSSGSYISQPYPAYYQPQFIPMPVADSEHTSNAASPEDQYTAPAYQPQPQK